MSSDPRLTDPPLGSLQALLYGEYVRKRVDLVALAQALDCRPMTARHKVTGDNPMTAEEALIAVRVVGSPVLRDYVLTAIGLMELAPEEAPRISNFRFCRERAVPRSRFARAWRALVGRE